MSSPITHIVLTEKVFDKYFAGLDKKKFIIGTSFPDIRYLANLDREVTHFESMRMKDILGEDSFVAGFHFHSVVDRVMKENNKRLDLYSYFPPNAENTVEAIKTVIDMALKPKIDDWSEIRNIFDEVLDDELVFGASRVVVERWHSMLQDYFVKMPDYRNVLPGYIVNNAAVVTTNIDNLIDGLGDEKRKTIERLAEKTYEDIEKLIDIL